MTKYQKAINDLLEGIDGIFATTLNGIASEFGTEVLRILAEECEDIPTKYQTCIKGEHKQAFMRMFIQMCDKAIAERPDKEAEALYWKGLCHLWFEEGDPAKESLNKAEEYFEAERKWREGA